MPYTNFLSVIFLINLFLLQGCSSSQHYKRASQAECRPRQKNIKTIPISEKTNKNTAIPSITPRIKAKIIKKEPQKINKPPSSKRKTSIKKECKKKCTIPSNRSKDKCIASVIKEAYEEEYSKVKVKKLKQGCVDTSRKLLKSCQKKSACI